MQGERRRARAEWRVRELLSHRFLRHVERTLPPGEFDRHLERMTNEEYFPRLSVLDLGCGMGLTGTVAAALGAQVLFADLEAPALLFARLNSLPWADRVRTRRLDWRKDRLDQRFDLIVGADILYERKQWDHLEPFWREHLRPGGMVVLGEPGRQTGELFIDWVRGRGWRLQQLAEPVETRSKPIRLFRLTPPR